jgi:multidrug efflux pump subunit AcrA (membrane-fusion protein)
MDLSDANSLAKGAKPRSREAGAGTSSASKRSGAPAAPGAWLLALQAQALKHEEPAAAALAVLAELALHLGCERASLGWLRHGRVRLAALSAGDAQTRQSLARHLEAAMDEALDERAVVLYPVPTLPALPAPAPRAAGMVAAHAELLRHNGGVPVATVPIVIGERLLGALLLERRDAFDPRTLRRAQDAALFVCPLLEMQQRLHGPLSARLAQAIAPRGQRLGAGPGVRPAHVLLAALPLVLAGLAMWPLQHEVVAPARLEGGQQRVIAAPLDGFIATAPVRPGAEVKAGDLLVALQDRDLELQRQRWLAEIAQLDKQYREALTHDEAAPIAMARARLEQAQAQLALAEAELARTRITAPFDGVVIAGDLVQATGMPVQRGQTLFTLAPALQLKVVAEVDEQDIAWLARGQNARVLFAAQGQAVARFTVERVSPVATVAEGRNVFEIEGALTPAVAGAGTRAGAGTDSNPGAGADAGAATTLRPGQRGIARIEIGQRRAGQAAWEQLGHWVRRWTWRLLG